MKRTIITLILLAVVFVATLLFTNAYVSQKSITAAEKINEMALNNCALYISNFTLCAEEPSIDSLTGVLKKNLPYGMECSSMFIADSSNTIIASSHEWLKEYQDKLRANTHIFDTKEYVDDIYLPVVYEGVQYYVYKRSTSGIPWTIYTICGEDAMYHDAWVVFWVLTFTALIGMALMLICSVVIFRQVKANLKREAAVEEELKMAAKVQMALLKSTTFSLPHHPTPTTHHPTPTTLQAFMKPARDAGGDLYDYVEKEGDLVFCIGDVSGKGMPAALFMTQVVSLFRSAVRNSSDPAQITSQINDVLAQNNPDMTFCTFFVGVLRSLPMGEGGGRGLEYCNAGHNPPVLIHHPSPTFLKVRPNLALGLMEGFPYTSETIELSAGQSLLLYTDGVTEAKNAKRDEYTDDRLIKTLITPADDVITHVLDDVRLFVGDYEQSDDITLVHVG